jgi:hypothetical protein
VVERGWVMVLASRGDGNVEGKTPAGRCERAS